MSVNKTFVHNVPLSLTVIGLKKKQIVLGAYSFKLNYQIRHEQDKTIPTVGTSIWLDAFFIILKIFVKIKIC